MSKMAQRYPGMLFLSIFLPAVFVAEGREVSAQGVAGIKDLQQFLVAGDFWTPAGVWRKFVEHQIREGREELIFENLDDSLKDLDDDRLGGLAAGLLGPEAFPMPDLARGDPILGILFRQSGELINLHALFDEAGQEGGVRDEKIASLIEKLRPGGDPFLGSYADFYAARHAMEKDDTTTAVEIMERLVKSEYFLPRYKVRRLLASLYRSRGEVTLAILELQFYLKDLSDDHSTERKWAEDQLAEIRKDHDGPLHDIAGRTRDISETMSEPKLDQGVQSEQKDVEVILEKIVLLMEEETRRQIEEMLEQMQEQMQQQQQLHQQQQQQQQQLQQLQQQQQQQANQQQEGNRNKPRDETAGKTRLRQGDAAEVNLRKLTPDEKEMWGKINDREVRRSLQEVWGRMPTRYRKLVSQYYKDINDLSPPAKKPAASGAKKGGK